MGGRVELVEGILPVPGTPIAYMPEYRVLILSDLHLGLEESLASTGIYIPRVQLSKIISIVGRVLGNMVKADVLLINGDVKHSFSHLSKQERFEVRKFLNLARNYVEEIVIVRGNHDNYLPLALKGLDVELVEAFEIGSYRFVHGHKREDLSKVEEEIIVIGHEHPSIALRDELGYVAKFPCFLAGELRGGKSILVLPAMSIYASGTNATVDKYQYLSPIIREYGLVEDFKPYIFDEEIGVLELPRLREL